MNAYMNFSFARLWSLIGSLCSGLATKRWLLLALFVQGLGATGYLYLERNWIEAGVVQSLKNVSSMHRRSFEQLDTTIRYQLLSVGEAMLVNRNPDPAGLNDNTLLKTEISHPWLDAIIVLDPTGKIVASNSDVPLASILPANVLAVHSFMNVPQYRAIHDGISTSFFVSRPLAPELGSGGLAIYRRITSPDGSTMGSVIGFTSQQSLSTLLDTDAERGFNLGKNGILTIIDGHTHEVFYRYSYDEGSVKMNNVLSQGGGKATLLDTRYGPDVKSFRSPIDGVERLAVLQTLHQGQWLQVVGASKNEYLFKWRLEVTFSVLLFVCLSVLQWLLMRAFERSRQQRALLDLVLDSVDACVYFKTSDRRFAYVNANTAALYDLPVEQVIGRRDSDMLPQKIADDFWVNDSKVLTSGIKHNFTEISVNAQGETRYYSSVKVPAQLPGQLPALVGISTDVTDLHQQTLAREAAEKELAAHNHSLWLHNQVLVKLGENAPLSEVLDTMVRIINEYRPGMMGAVFLLSEDGRELTGCAGPDLHEEWWSISAQLPLTEGYGSAVTAVLRGETIIAADVATHPSWSALREVACRQGLRAAWAQPIKDNEGKILGVCLLYTSPSPRD